jgi:hypothetical protein
MVEKSFVERDQEEKYICCNYFLLTAGGKPQQVRRHQPNRNVLSLDVFNNLAASS